MVKAASDTRRNSGGVARIAIAERRINTVTAGGQRQEVTTLSGLAGPSKSPFPPPGSSREARQSANTAASTVKAGPVRAVTWRNSAGEPAMITPNA